ncbi:hypothetical protein [Mycolicibacterium fortuitum]|uniref:hypothetical protein n=1 Tax=Mycolicibacterium fortuitum TaxID=1766 RepID=UPI001CDD38BF|nr:hypothetical protein [Mycolicibacterium fortuitum]UBV14959.1 hypothetical protein H8Z57_30475 [Mycolicibacterium fortuitum]
MAAISDVAARIRTISDALAENAERGSTLARERRHLIASLRAWGLTPEQIAEHTALSVGTVWKLTHQARRDKHAAKGQS